MDTAQSSSHADGPAHELAEMPPATPQPHAPKPSLRRRVFNLAWPVIGENFLQTMLGIVDTIMVARLGPGALAGVGAAIQIMFFVISALSAVSVGSSVLVAQAVGAHRLEQASRYAKQSLVWSVIISIPLLVVGLIAAEPIISIFGMEPDVTRMGTEYLQVTMGTVGVLVLLLLGGGVLRGAGDSRTPMLITLIANVVNVALTYGLIFGELGMPKLGVVGSAWGTFLSRLLGFGLLWIVMWRGVNGVSIRGSADWWPNWATARQLLSIGIPAAVEQMLISTAFLILSITVAGLGTVALAAHRIALNAMSISFLPGIGFALAATALVGQCIGAQRLDEARAVGQIATTWAIAWMGALGIIFFFFAEGIIAIFIDDPVVIEMGGAALRAIALIQPFWAISFVQAGALRGTGDTRFPLRANTTNIWITVGLGIASVHFLNGGLTTIWAAFIVTTPIVAVVMWRRFRWTIERGVTAVT